MTTNGSFSQQDQYKTENEQLPVTSNTSETTSGNSSRHTHTKDEVGWCFVEQFYTTLGQNPEKLHLFYGANSQFVYGPEAESSPVSIGRDAIQERFKELNFQESKVRISNVDSQASYDSIVVQVIGEISHLSAEPKKFVQSFVLAKQPNGYFVLNDIFRLINDDMEEENVDSSPEEIIPTTSLGDKPEIPKDFIETEQSPAPSKIETVDKNLQKAAESEDQSNQESTTNGAIIDVGPVATINEVTTNKTVDQEPRLEASERITEERPKEPEKLQESSPSLTSARPQYTNKTHATVQPTGPPKPLSWANRAAAAAVGPNLKPAVPVVPSKNTIPSQNRTSSNTKQVQVTNTVPNIQHDKEKENTPIGSGWQTAGENPKKQNRPQSISALPEKEGTLGYIRNVTEKINPDDLHSLLSSFGTLNYFDVNRFKTCAFVEFTTPEGYQAAFNASPHQISGESIYLEPRRPKPNSYGNGYGGGRGGVNQRGRTGFSNRNRGSGAFSRGRGHLNNA